MRIQVKGLEHHAHFRPHFINIGLGIKNIHPIHQDLTVIRGFQPVQAAQKRTFSRTGGTDDHHHFTGFNGVGYIHQGLDFMRHMKCLVNMLDVYHLVAVLLSRY